MNNMTLVVRDDAPFLKELKDRELIVVLEDPGPVHDVYTRINEDNRVICIQVLSRRPLSAVELSDTHKNIPIALYATERGSFKKVLSRVAFYRESNLRIFMPADNSENLTSLRILSSLGVHCGLYFPDGIPVFPWDGINDLMHYSVYGKANHTPIEPFHYAEKSYKPQETFYFHTPFFENPGRFLHIDNEGNIALSSRELAAGDFICSGVETIDTITEIAEYQTRLSQWHEYFLENDDCAYCQAWRVCRGLYLKQCREDEQCREFFKDFLDALDFSYSKSRSRAVWQL